MKTFLSIFILIFLILIEVKASSTEALYWENGNTFTGEWKDDEPVN